MKKSMIAIIAALILVGTVLILAITMNRYASPVTEAVRETAPTVTDIVEPILLKRIAQANQNESLRKNDEAVAFRITEYDSEGNAYSAYNYLDQERTAFEAEGNVTIFEKEITYGFDDVQKRVFADLYLDDTRDGEIPPISGFDWSADEVVIEMNVKNDLLVVHSQSTEESLPSLLESLGYVYEGEAVAFNEYIVDTETYAILEYRVYVHIPGMNENVKLIEATRVMGPNNYDTADEIKALVFPEENLRTIVITADPDTEKETVYSMNIGKGCMARVNLSCEHPYLYSDRACTLRYERNDEDYDSDMILFTKAVFAYAHDPRLNPSAMEDIVENPDAIYGFSPNPESSRLGAYAAYDWTDAEVVEKGRQDRIAYHESLNSLYDLLYEMRGKGSTIEQMARAVSAERNRLRLESYRNDPDGLARVKQSNLETYGDENGPTADSLFEKYGSWETVLQKAFGTNAGMDACVGLYDTYYTLYIELGMIHKTQ